MKIRSFLSVLIIFCAIALYSCSSSKDTSGIAPQTGDYSYSLLDSAGKKLLDGSFTIVNVADGKLDGSYKKPTFYDSSFSGYTLIYDGGKFTGSYKPTGEVGMNMNPLLSDNNFYLGGKVIGDNIMGTWSHSTMTGGKAKGKFSAVLK